MHQIRTKTREAKNTETSVPNDQKKQPTQSQLGHERLTLGIADRVVVLGIWLSVGEDCTAASSSSSRLDIAVSFISILGIECGGLAYLNGGFRVRDHYSLVAHYARVGRWSFQRRFGWLKIFGLISGGLCCMEQELDV